MFSSGLWLCADCWPVHHRYWKAAAASYHPIHFYFGGDMQTETMLRSDSGYEIGIRIGPCAFPVLYICFLLRKLPICIKPQGSSSTSLNQMFSDVLELEAEVWYLHPFSVKFYSIHSLYVFIRTADWSIHHPCTNSHVSGCWWTGYVAYWWAPVVSGDEERCRLAINGSWLLPEISFFLISSKRVWQKMSFPCDLLANFTFSY